MSALEGENFCGVVLAALIAQSGGRLKVPDKAIQRMAGKATCAGFEGGGEIKVINDGKEVYLEWVKEGNG